MLLRPLLVSNILVRYRLIGRHQGTNCHLKSKNEEMAHQSLIFRIEGWNPWLENPKAQRPQMPFKVIMKPLARFRKDSTSDYLLLCFQITSRQLSSRNGVATKRKQSMYRSRYQFFSTAPLSLIQFANSFRLACKVAIKSANRIFQYSESPSAGSEKR